MTAKYERLAAIVGDVSRETFDRLLQFELSFLKWAARINLAAPSTLDDVWERHILDSAQLLPLAASAARWVDIGSGGGFPGAVIAILLAESDARVELVESNRKKCAFLQNVLGVLAPRAVVHPRRIEEAVRGLPAPDVLTARALAPLPALLALSEPWLQQGTRALFHKGHEYRGELKLAHDTWNLDLIEHRSVIDSRGVILEVRRMSRKA